MSRLSDCCYYSVEGHSGKCNWCGFPCTPTEERDDLYREIDALLCDWNRPSSLATFDLKENVGAVYRFVRKKLKDTAGGGDDG